MEYDLFEKTKYLVNQVRIEFDLSEKECFKLIQDNISLDNNCWNKELIGSNCMC